MSHIQKLRPLKLEAVAFPLKLRLSPWSCSFRLLGLYANFLFHGIYDFQNLKSQLGTWFGSTYLTLPPNVNTKEKEPSMKSSDSSCFLSLTFHCYHMLSCWWFIEYSKPDVEQGQNHKGWKYWISLIHQSIWHSYLHTYIKSNHIIYIYI